MTGNRRPAWHKRRNRVYASLIAVLGTFIVWTTWWPVENPGWYPQPSAGQRLHALPVPMLALIMVVVLVVWAASRLGPRRPF